MLDSNHHTHSNIHSYPSGNKYVPPHLRNSQGGGRGGGGYNRSQNNDNGFGRGGRDDRRGSYNDRGGRGGYNKDLGGGAAPPPQVNSRWAGVADGPSYGGGPDDRRGAYGGGGGRGGGRGYARVNERGFHGDMTPDKRLEARLFDNSEKQSTGINFDNYDKIPIEVSGENIPDPIENYSVDTIGEDLFRNTQMCGYARPTPVQKYSVPIGMAGRDLMACAQTGSGETAGFLFPILMAMIRRGGRQPPDNGGPRRSFPNALVLAPTRELAQQIHEEAKRFAYCTGIASVVIYGGADVRDQLRQIERGCDLLVATPGRLVDLIERGRMGMECVGFLVLDEADRM